MSKITDIYGKDWHLIAGKVKAEKNYTCETCGKTKDYLRKIRITVHHIDGNPKNNERSNLQCICNICHLQKQKFLQARYINTKKEELGQGNIINPIPINPKENTIKII
jgi:5-methylcytosine-specific restriction endonuclease McrA